MLKLSDKIQPAAQLSVMDELCNQSINIKEDMEHLEMELKTYSKRTGEKDPERNSSRNADVLYSSDGW